MCEIFVSADPALYASRSRSLRLHGVVTCIRLENLYWDVLEEIAGRDDLTLGQLVARLHDEVVEAQGGVDNFASFLRVSCLRYMALQADGAIPRDLRVPIRSLIPAAVLGRDRYSGRRQPERLETEAAGR